MSYRRSPFDELERYFESMAQSWDERPRWASSLGLVPMALDIVDVDDAFRVTVDLPGWDREDVDVRVSDHTLRIQATRDEDEAYEDEQYVRRERHRESLHRSLTLPEPVDAGAVTATMSNGVLTIDIPKLAPAESARKIEIESE